MRTTLTIDDELFEELRRRAAEKGVSFKAVVNETIRRGLQTGELARSSRKEFRVKAKPGEFRPGVDLTRLNQLLDEIEIDERAGSAAGIEKIADS